MGRIEYLLGVAVSIIIIVVGVQLGLESIDKIMNPQPVDAGLLPMLVLVASICVKGYMFAYNRRHRPEDKFPPAWRQLPWIRSRIR